MNASFVIQKRSIYVDTLAVRTEYDLNPFPYLGALNRACAGKVWPQPSRLPKQWVVVMQQPRPGAYELAEALCSEGGCVYGLDVSLDLEVATAAEATALMAHVARGLVIRYHGRQEVCWVFGSKKHPRPGLTLANDWPEATRYTSEKRPQGTTQLLMYSSKPSKLTGNPCCHIELRITGQAVKRLGVLRPLDVPVLGPRALFKRRLAMYHLDVAQLGRALRGRLNSKKPDLLRHGRFIYDCDRAAGRAFAHIAAATLKGSDEPVKVDDESGYRQHVGREPFLTVQSIIDYARDIGRQLPRRTLQQIPIDDFLPVAGCGWSFVPDKGKAGADKGKCKTVPPRYTR